MEIDAQLQAARSTCPACGSNEIVLGETITSLAGFGPDTSPDADPNESVQSCVCRFCRTGFVIHWIPKDRKVWVE